jgi:hypothetical protein
MHNGRIALLERLQKAEVELLASLEEIERVAGAPARIFDTERTLLGSVTGGAYRLAMDIDDCRLTP